MAAFSLTGQERALRVSSWTSHLPKPKCRSEEAHHTTAAVHLCGLHFNKKIYFERMKWDKCKLNGKNRFTHQLTVVHRLMWMNWPERLWIQETTFPLAWSNIWRLHSHLKGTQSASSAPSLPLISAAFSADLSNFPTESLFAWKCQQRWKNIFGYVTH